MTAQGKNFLLVWCVLFLYSAGKPCIPIDFSQRYYIMDFASA